MTRHALVCFQAFGVRSNICFLALLFPEGWETTENKRQLFEWELVWAPKHFCCGCLGGTPFVQGHSPWLTRGANRASPSSHWHSLGGGFTFCSTGHTFFAGLCLVFRKASLLLLGYGACPQILPCPVLGFAQALALELNVKWCRQRVYYRSVIHRRSQQTGWWSPSSLSIHENTPKNNLRRFWTITKIKHSKVHRSGTFYERAWKIPAEEGSELFLLLFQGFWKSETVPNNQGKSSLLFLHLGDKWDCSSKHRHINLASIPGKIIQRHIRRHGW